MKKPVNTDESLRAAAFRLEDWLPYHLSVAADSVSQLIARDHLARSGLAMAEWRLLAAIGRFGVLSPTAAGQRTSMDKVKISRASASLVARGLLRQLPDPEDGRGRLLRLTRKGNTAYADVAATAHAVEANLAPGLSKTEWNALQRSLGKLSEHARTLLAGTNGT